MIRVIEEGLASAYSKDIKIPNLKLCYWVYIWFFPRSKYVLGSPSTKSNFGQF